MSLQAATESSPSRATSVHTIDWTLASTAEEFQADAAGAVVLEITKHGKEECEVKRGDVNRGVLHLR